MGGRHREVDGGEGLRLWHGYARLVVRARWAVIVAWVGAAVSSVLFLPPLGTGGDNLEAFTGNAAIAAELRSSEIFGFPLLGRVALVQHDPDGLSVFTQADAVLRGLAVNQGAYDTDILGALPIPNTLGAFPGSTADGTTVLTYLFQDPRSSFGRQQRVAEQFAEEHLDEPGDAYIGVTGSVPARAAQARLIGDSLHVVEVATLVAVLSVVALTFRSLTAPVVTLVSVGTAVLVTLGVAGSLATALGLSVPADLRPLIVALLLGVVTDYCIFYLSGLRARLAEGRPRLEAARMATADFTPIVTVAGVTVASGTATLVVARSELFRGFGPGMALTVAVGLVVAVTLVPALLAVFGRWAFWPTSPVRAEAQDAPSPKPSRVTRLVTGRRSARMVATGCVLGLGITAVPLLSLDLGLGFVQSLPREDPVARAAAAATEGFAPGILSPTELLIEAEGLGAQPEALRRLGEALERESGVAGVLGPGDTPVSAEFGLLVAGSGDAVRYLLVLDSPPLEATAIEDLRALRDRLPGLVAQSGLGEVRFSMAGDTALSAGVVQETTDDLLRISVAALGANLLMLVLFLRAVVAPLYLLASSVLALCATLGLTVAVFQGLLGHDGLTFYVPFAAAVLLLSLGSDYNIFAVGHIWHLARVKPLREAVLEAVPQSTRAITSAGVALAASFGMLALVPLRPFHELGFVLAAGILIDVFVVRALLVPSLLTIVGPASGWPSARLRLGTQPHRGDAGDPDPTPPASTPAVAAHR